MEIKVALVSSPSMTPRTSASMVSMKVGNSSGLSSQRA